MQREKMNITLYLLCFSLTFVKCCFFSGDDRPKVEEPTVKEFPFMASVDDGMGRTCPAVLINRHFILTVAECVEQAYEVRVYLGFQYPFNRKGIQEESTAIDPSTRVFINKNVAHGKNNIALIKLDQPVTLNDNIRPGKLLSEEEANSLKGEESDGRVVGWKNDQNTVTTQVEIIKLLRHDECSVQFKDKFLRSQEFCGETKVEGGIGSDKHRTVGNVLTINNKIVGFMVQHNDCKWYFFWRCDKLRLFINVAPFLSWISQKADVSIKELTTTDLDPLREKMEVLEKQIQESHLKCKTLGVSIAELTTTDLDPLRKKIEVLEKEIKESHLKCERVLLNMANIMSNDIKSLRKNVTHLHDLIDKDPIRQ